MGVAGPEAAFVLWESGGRARWTRRAHSGGGVWGFYFLTPARTRPQGRAPSRLARCGRGCPRPVRLGPPALTRMPCDIGGALPPLTPPPPFTNPSLPTLLLFFHPFQLSPHKEAIRANLCALLGADPSAVNLKAKTHEKVDSLGEGRSVAVHAVVLLVRK